MPVQLEWHPTLPILIATYSGVLSPDDYQTMYKRRQAMLQEGPSHIIFLVNLQQMESLSEIAKIRRGDNVIYHNKVYKTLVVVKPDLYRSLRRAITDTAGYDLPVVFFRDTDTALAQAETLSQGLG